MSRNQRLSRRNLLRATLAAGAGSLLPMGASLAQQKDNKSSSVDRKVFLFLDWFHVKKGELQNVLDPERISDAGKKQLETYIHDFNKRFEQGPHGFRQTDIPSGVRIVQEVAERSPPWLSADKPWEKGATSPTVLFDEGRYRCWYSARLADEEMKSAVEGQQVMELKGSALAYAESSNGFNWTKPSLGVVAFRGSKENNLLSPYSNGGSVFRDDHGPADQRYKSFHFDELPKDDVAENAAARAKYGLYGVTSADGHHWTKNAKPLVRYFSDTINVGGWDPLLNKYVGYFRNHFSSRTISRAETEDFWNWPAPEPLLYGGPLDAPADDFYTNCYTRYPGDPSLRLLFPAIYHRDSDSVDVRLAVSRDGRVFQWVSYDPIITLGAAGAWDGGSIYAQPNLVQLPDGRLALPYDGYNTTHNEVWFKIFYGDYDSRTGIAWALWKDARLAGIEAAQLGQFTTTSARFDGKQIEINARTKRGGSVEVELRERGKPLEGFSFAESVPFSGDAIWMPCHWTGKENLAALAGKQLELGIRLRSAKIFASRFV